MSIGVQSYPELYTTLMGFGLYDKLWEILTQTGIAYLPFLGMIFRNFTKNYAENVTHHAGPASLRSLEVELIVTILIILFAVAPCIPIDARAVSYTPQCGVNKDQTVYPGDTGTTYDKAFSLPQGDIRVPMWWYAVIAISEGMTSASNTMLSCPPNLRKMITQVDMAQISDPEVKQELQDFESMCYRPSRNQFNQDKQNNILVSLNRIEKEKDKYGIADTEWVGSHGFSDVYYKNLKSSRPIPGFTYDATQDINADVKGKTPPAFGTPTCYEWWNDQQNGLRTKLYLALPKEFFSEFNSFVSDEKTQDSMLKSIISNAVSGYDSANKTIGDSGYSHAAAAVGIWFHQLEEYPKLYAASQAAPIIQALILLMIYVFLPFTLVFSNYRPSTVVTGGILIFSVIFWGFIWHLVTWADTALMQALYSDWFSKQGAAATLADMIIASLIIFAPLFWFVFMGAMGVAAGDIASSIALGINKIGASSANKGAEVAKFAGKAATKAILP
jgi:hypothetical protein